MPQAKPALEPRPIYWNNRTLASIASDLENVMGRWNTPTDAYSQLFKALNAIEEADFYMPEESGA